MDEAEQLPEHFAEVARLRDELVRADQQVLRAASDIGRQRDEIDRLRAQHKEQLDAMTKLYIDEANVVSDLREQVAALADSIQRVIVTIDGRVLAAMIREGVTGLDSHVRYAFNGAAEITSLRAELGKAAQLAAVRLDNAVRYEFSKTLEGQVIVIETLKTLGSASLDQALDDAMAKASEPETDQYGNPLSGDRIINCCFPDCGCDGARLCQAENGASSSSRSMNLERGRQQKGRP